MSGADTVQLLVLERREAAANMARFYVLSLEDTLFGDTALVGEWVGSAQQADAGSTYTRLVRRREALESWLGRRLRRGYRAR